MRFPDERPERRRRVGQQEIRGMQAGPWKTAPAFSSASAIDGKGLRPFPSHESEEPRTLLEASAEAVFFAEVDPFAGRNRQQ
ncbi:hypothetical protein [Azorhizophilus paspali]|uniref:Transposase n=1 Tax=Azorhizophilus paspali TaxID=69963 RepID=A0ABV6SLF7_AZOPA